MKTPLFIILAVATALLISSCTKNETIEFGQNYLEPNYPLTLEKVGEYIIPVDSLTSTNVLHYQYFKDNEVEYFTMLNKITQEINFYDINLRQLAFKVPLKYEGPNSVGNLKGFNAGYHIRNLDSIFVFNRNQFELFLLDSSSTVINFYHTRRDGYLPSAVIAPFAPMRVHGDKALLLNFQNGMNYDRPNSTYRAEYATRLDLNSHSADYFLSYPEHYQKGAWGFDLHRISWAFDEKKHRIIVSYALDHNLYTYDFEGNFIERIPAPSEAIQKARSITRKDIETKRDNQYYYKSQDKFDQVFYDPIREVIIRDCIAGVPIESLQAGVQVKPKRRLVLINNQNEKIAEMEESTPGLLVMFFNDQGIHKLIETNNEDELKFEIYKYVASDNEKLNRATLTKKD